MKQNWITDSAQSDAKLDGGGAAAPISAGQMETLEHFIVTAHNRNSNKVSNNNNNNKKERERERESNNNKSSQQLAFIARKI